MKKAKKNRGGITRRNFLKTSAVGLGMASIGFGCSANFARMTGSSSKMPETISEAGKRFRDGSLSSERLTKVYLECIKKLEPKLNCFITLTEEYAIKTAQSLDAELKSGKDRGPLHGIPIVHKDLYDTAGFPTTVGSEFFRKRVPKEDATVVRKLKEAGVVMLGKTNMNEFAAGISGTNQFYGDTHNPWALDRSPGGSSSGTGAAIVAGLCLGGTGSDTGGSIRVPASWLNIAGIRPTFGLVSLYGVYPRAYSLDVAGPLARTVKDCAILLNSMAGYDPKYRYSLNVPREDFSAELTKGVKGIKLGIIENYTFREIDPDVHTAVKAAVDKLASSGAEIKNVKIPLFGGPLEYSSLFNMLLYEFNQILGDQFRATPNRKEVFGPIVQANIDRGMKITKETYEKAKSERPKQIAEVKKVFKEVDALLTPTMPTTAPPLAGGSKDYDRGRQFTLPFSWTGLPSVAIPCGFSPNGLPIGLQIVGNELQERLLLRIASAYEGATNFYKRRPPVNCSESI
jgi:aspartyl-tRNA(Asn)/glutamyl-tRNA(Gln) amidotransferase subunit A